MKAISTQKKFHYWIVFINRKCQENMILTAYIFICIMSGSSNTASPYNYFQGESSLADVQNAEDQPIEDSNHQRRFGSNLNGMSSKFIPVSYPGNRFIYTKNLRNIDGTAYFPEHLATDKVGFNTQKRRSKNARRNSKNNNRAIEDDTESIKKLFNKSGPPLEYFKKTFQVAVDSKEDSPELFRTKNLEKWRKNNLPHRTRMKNKGRSFKRDSTKYFQRPNESKSRFMQNSNKRSVDVQSEESALPLEMDLHSNPKCQALESMNLLQKLELGKLLDSDAYKKCLLIHNANKVELLVENKQVSSKFLNEAFHRDLFSVFKVMDKFPGTVLYESEVTDDHINPLDNIQLPFDNLKKSNFLNTNMEDDNVLPIESNKVPSSENGRKEWESSSTDEDVANMRMLNNNVGDIGNFNHDDEIEHGLTENYPVDQMPIKNFYENLPSAEPVDDKTVKDNNYVQIENKEILSKITFPINDTASKELLAASIKKFKPTTLYQLENHFSIITSNYTTPINQISLKTNNVSALPPAGYERTEFPINKAKKEQVLEKVLKDIVSPSSSTNIGIPELGNKARQPLNQLFTERILNILPKLIPSSSLKYELLETTTKTSQIEELIKQTKASTMLNPITQAIHIVITEPIIAQKISEDFTDNTLKGNAESDYNNKNPPVDMIDKEEKPESDIKMLKMHYRHPHASQKPEIRHKRQ